MTIALIVFGILFLVFLGTCAILALCEEVL
jgi:hypothetical protein